MLCEKCTREVETAECKRCGTIAKVGPFCYLCGQELEKPVQASREEAGEDDFSARILCSDGTCIGVIDEQGLCKVCGKPYSPESSG